MKRKLLSVVIAAYNMEQFIEETLESLVCEEVTERLEVLVIDDGSTDGTAKKVEKYVNQYPDSFVLIRKKNGGWGSVLNYGIEIARGKYFKTLDADDWLQTKNLAQFVSLLDEVECDMILNPYYEVNSLQKKFAIGNREDYGTLGDISGFGELSEDFGLYMHSMTFRTELIKGLRVTEHCFYTDLEYIVKAVNRCESIRFSPVPVYCYRVGREGQSISYEGLGKHYHDSLRVMKELTRFYKSEVEEESKKRIIRHAICELARRQYENFIFAGSDERIKQEIKKYDRWLKSEFPEGYLYLVSRKIRFLRKTKFRGYRLVAEYYRKNKGLYVIKK